MIFRIIWTLICGGVVGWIAGKLMHCEGNLLQNIMVGIAGSAIGSVICALIGIYSYGFIFGIIVDVAGACLLLWIVSRFAGRR
ncbi:MAG: GlsB/YeaQ/YmgE family stress response membrane protein [Oscillospiraceae bacterium]|nr:GlsB/YeaQ/YmgE family stress response membrane protein [Oscillospiraceae bacterium]